MKRIKTILTIVAVAAISVLIWAKPLDAGEVEIIALNWQEQPQEAPNTFMVTTYSHQRKSGNLSLSVSSRWILRCRSICMSYVRRIT